MAALRTSLTKLFTGTELTYNGYTIPPEGLKVNVSIQPAHDRGNKSRIYDVCTLTADFVVANEGTSETNTDALVHSIRKKLTKQGQILHIKGWGFGDIHVRVNTSTTHGGPYCRGFDWETLHSNRIAHIVWTIEFAVPGCDIGSRQSGDLVSFDYSVQATMDDASGGQIRLVTTGQVEMLSFPNIPGTEFQFTSVKARDLLEKKFPRRDGYQRSYDTTFSEDRRFLTFSITDVEFYTDTPLPEPIADLQLAQRLSSSLEADGNFTIWHWSLNAAVSVFLPHTPGHSLSRNKALAWVALGRIIIDRLIRFKNQTYTTSTGEEPANVQLFVDHIDVGDQVTAHTFDYSIRGRLFASSSVIFQSCGMFQPLGGLSNTWQQRKNFIDQIGNNEIPIYYTHFVDMQSEEIINLCNFASGNPPTTTTSLKPTGVQAQLVETDRPSPDDSWYEYQYQVTLMDDNESVANVPLSENPPRLEELRQSGEKVGAESPIGDPLSSGLTADIALTPIVTMHNPTPKTFYVTLTGFATRIGYRINAPNLIKYGGMKAVKVGKDQIVSNVSPPKIDKLNQSAATYRLKWRKTYMLVVPDPTQNISPSNPNEPVNDKYITDVPNRFKHKGN